MLYYCQFYNNKIINKSPKHKQSSAAMIETICVLTKSEQRHETIDHLNYGRNQHLDPAFSQIPFVTGCHANLR